MRQPHRGKRGVCSRGRNNRMLFSTLGLGKRGGRRVHSFVALAAEQLRIKGMWNFVHLRCVCLAQL